MNTGGRPDTDRISAPFREQFSADLGEDTAKEIREVFLPDFSEWKTHEGYRPAFARLLNALTSTE